MSSEFIGKLSFLVNNVESFSDWQIFRLGSPISSSFDRFKFLNKIRSYGEIYGNIYELKLLSSSSFYQIDDGTMTIDLIDQTHIFKSKYKHILESKPIKLIFNQFYDFNVKKINFILPTSYLSNNDLFYKNSYKNISYLDINKELLSLTPAEVNDIEYLFGLELNQYAKYYENLILLQPLWEEGLVDNLEREVEIYNSIINEHAPNSPVYLKPHPRSNVDYAKAFPNCHIIDKDFPYELLIITGATFGKVITLSSSGTEELREQSEEIIVYDEDNNYKY